MIFDDNPLNDDCLLCGNCVFWLPAVPDFSFGFCIGYQGHVFGRQCFKMCDRFVHVKRCSKDLQDAHNRFGLFCCSKWIQGGMPK